AHRLDASNETHHPEPRKEQRESCARRPEDGEQRTRMDVRSGHAKVKQQVTCPNTNPMFIAVSPVATSAKPRRPSTGYDRTKGVGVLRAGHHQPLRFAYAPLRDRGTETLQALVRSGSRGRSGTPRGPRTPRVQWASLPFPRHQGNRQPGN